MTQPQTHIPDLCPHCGWPTSIPSLSAPGDRVAVTQAEFLDILDGIRQTREQVEFDQAYAVRALRRMGVPWSVLERQSGVSKSTLVRQQREAGD